jgi:hypothetical protein
MTNLLEKAVKKWWFYLIILLLFFIIPSYTQKGAGYQEAQNVIKEVLTNPLIYTFTPLFWASKIVFVLLVLLLIFQGKRMPKAFATAIAIFYVGIGIFQNTAQTSTYGLAIISGNVLLMLVVAVSWIAEATKPKSDFALVRMPLWKWWVLPFAGLAFWFPVNASGSSPQFTLTNLVSNGSMLTYCMMTPVVLAILTIFYPHVNLATMRVTSYVGIMFGATNEVEWFVLHPSMWWMGILHIPLITISLYAFAITFSGAHQMEERLLSYRTYALTIFPRQRVARARRKSYVCRAMNLEPVWV